MELIADTWKEIWISRQLHLYWLGSQLVPFLLLSLQFYGTELPQTETRLKEEFFSQEHNARSEVSLPTILLCPPDFVGAYFGPTTTSIWSVVPRWEYPEALLCAVAFSSTQQAWLPVAIQGSM